MSYPSYLIHYGIKGQKWGERKYQYEDGSLTPEGRKHYGIGEKDLEEMKKLSKKKRSNDGKTINLAKFNKDPLLYQIQSTKYALKRIGPRKAGKKLDRMIDDNINENDKNKIKKLNKETFQKEAKLDLKKDNIYNNEKLSEEIKLKKIKDIDKEIDRTIDQYNKNLEKILGDSLGESYKNLDKTDSLKIDIDSRVERYH